MTTIRGIVTATSIMKVVQVINKLLTWTQRIAATTVVQAIMDIMIRGTIRNTDFANRNNKQAYSSYYYYYYYY